MSLFVDCAEKRITLQTLYHERTETPPEYTDIVWEDVLAYHFQNDTMGSILFDVAPVSFDEIWQNWEPVFVQSKNYGWPAFLSHTDKADLYQQLAAREIKAFVVSASAGIEGFVLAQSMTILPHKFSDEK